MREKEDDEGEGDEEIYEADGGTIFITIDGDVKIKCGKNIKKIGIDNMGLRMLQGISDIAKTQKNKVKQKK